MSKHVDKQEGGVLTPVVIEAPEIEMRECDLPPSIERRGFLRKVGLGLGAGALALAAAKPVFGATVITDLGIGTGDIDYDSMGGVVVPDSTETDQGAVGSGKSVKDLIDSIGSDSGTLRFRHDSGGASTSYVFSTSEVIPSNIAVVIEQGAVLTIGSGITVTINGSFNADLYQVFSGDGFVLLKNTKEVYIEWYGAVSDAINPNNATGPITGTDSTSAIQKTVLSVIHSTAHTTLWPHKTTKKIITCASGSSFKVAGTNIFGYDFGVLGTAASGYIIDGKGSSFYWQITNQLDTFIDYCAYLNALVVKNFTLVRHESANISSLGIFMRSQSPVSPGISFWQQYQIEGVHIYGNGASFYRVFDIDGWSHCDKTKVSNSTFNGFKALYYSTNREAVDWAWNSCYVFSEVTDVIFFQWEGQFSGGYVIENCEIASYGDNTTFFKTSSSDPITKADNGYIDINTRMETKTGIVFTIVDAQHGRFSLKNINSAGGSGDISNGTSCILKDSAEVSFDACILPSNIILQVLTGTEWDSTHLGGLSDTQLKFNRCIIAYGVITPQYINSSGVSKTFREALAGNLYIPIVSVDFNHTMYKFGLSRGQVSEHKNNLLICSYRAGSVGQTYLTDKHRLPSYCFITSIKVVHSGVPGNFVAIGVFFGNDATPLFEIPVTPGSTEIVEGLSSNTGISVPFSQDNDYTKISFKWMDSSHAVVSSQIMGWAELEYSFINSAMFMPATDIVTLY